MKRLQGNGKFYDRTGGDYVGVFLKTNDKYKTRTYKRHVLYNNQQPTAKYKDEKIR